MLHAQHLSRAITECQSLPYTESETRCISVDRIHYLIAWGQLWDHSFPSKSGRAVDFSFPYSKYALIWNVCLRNLTWNFIGRHLRIILQRHKHLPFVLSFTSKMGCVLLAVGYPLAVVIAPGWPETAFSQTMEIEPGESTCQQKRPSFLELFLYSTNARSLSYHVWSRVSDSLEKSPGLSNKSDIMSLIPLPTLF